MSRTITALYDTRSDAEAARSRLTAANIDADNVRIVDQNEGSSGMGSSSSSMTGNSSSSSPSSSGGFLGAIKNMFVSDDDRHSYNEGIRRGGALLYANVDEDDVDRAITILEETSSVDMDEREQSWKSEGWAGYTAPAATTSGMGASTATPLTGMGRSDADMDRSTTDMDRSTTDRAFVGGNADTSANEERIQLAEEQLTVGKREVNRGGARIRSYVVEKPVTEQVTLREEHVNIERRPVSGSTAGTADTGALFQERTVEMTETAEEAVVGKTARVTEELVVSKTAEQRTETISDTVRKTEVEIDEDVGRTSTTGTGMGGTTGTGMGGTMDRDRT